MDGITGASVGSGRNLELTLDQADALFGAGYTLHVDAAAEDMRDSPNEGGRAPDRRRGRDARAGPPLQRRFHLRFLIGPSHA